jgi:predicted RNA-binding protein with PIN domain
MALHVIVDGYNLLALTGRIGAGTSLHSEAARESFLHDLASYRQRKSHAITVVFDGWQQGWGTEQREHRLGLEIIFSRRGEKADQVIQRLAAEFGSACAVVSSDREIVNVAKEQGAFVMTAQEFIGKLRGPSILSRSSPHKELDTGNNLPPKRGSEKRGNPRKLPKALRQRTRQLKRF